MDTKQAPGFINPPAKVQVAETPVLIKDQGAEALKDIACGSVAGTMGKIVEYPFDTVKVRLQSQPDNLPLRYAGPLDCFRQSLQHDGFRGFFRGISAPLVGAAAETACLFWSYRTAQDVLRATVLSADIGEKLPLSALVTAGAMSGGVTSLILTPIELVKCRMQVPLQSSSDLNPGRNLNLSPQLNGPFTVMGEVWRREGLRGFWRGQFGTLLREVGGGAAWFGSYETLLLAFRARLQHPETDDLPVSQSLLAGAVAGMSYNFVFYPADTIKSKIQTGEFAHARPTFWGVGRELWHAHGLKGLYRGCGITVARSAPSSALIFTIYEGMRKFTDEPRSGYS